MAHTGQQRFEWDAAKDRANRRKHGLGFAEVAPLFDAEVETLVIFDESSSEEEDRFVTIGPIRQGLIVVVWTEPVDDVLRIISARFATKGESALYRKSMGTRR